MLTLERMVIAGAVALVCSVGPPAAHAANLLATETANPDTAVLTPDNNWDVTPFTSISSGESADGSGAFLANTTATGSALVVLTEGAGGANSDWLELVYSSSGSAESVTAHWRSDADPGGLPPLPTGVTPEFLVETGASQDVTGLLGASATASGFSFPSNITVQVQSDVEGAVPEPASLAVLSAALLGLGMVRRFRRS